MSKRFTCNEYYHYIVDNGEELSVCEAVDRLNDLVDENEMLKNSEVINNQKELQKLIYTTVINMIDDKIKEINEINEVTIVPRESITVLEDLKTELEGALK